MGSTEGSCLCSPSERSQSESLFERCSWFYAFCREHLFRDHTAAIAQSLFPAQPPEGTVLLELGCGPGFYSCELAQRYPQITATGFDTSTRLLQHASGRAARRRLRNCSFRRGDACSLPELPAPVDAIVLSRLFLVVADRAALLAEVFRVLRPGGRCFIAEPTSPLRTQVPLSCMRALERLSRLPHQRHCGPRRVSILSRDEFAGLLHSQPWATIEQRQDRRYQLAVCTKPLSPVGMPAAGAAVPSLQKLG